MAMMQQLLEDARSLLKSFKTQEQTIDNLLSQGSALKNSINEFKQASIVNWYTFTSFSRAGVEEFCWGCPHFCYLVYETTAYIDTLPKTEFSLFSVV